MRVMTCQAARRRGPASQEGRYFRHPEGALDGSHACHACE